MRRAPSVVAAAVIFAAFSFAVAAGGEERAVLFPPDQTLSLSDRVKVLAFVPGKEAVPVTVNGQNRSALEGEDFRAGEVPLYPGMNVLDVGGKKVRIYSLPNTKMEQFRASPSGSGGEGELVFTAYRLHPALDDGCGGCHEVAGGKLGTRPQKEACYGCHDDFAKGKGEGEVFVHKPVADGECTLCHDPHFGTRPKLLKSDKGCLECHDPFPAEGSVHYPVKEGECTACHGAHAGPQSRQLLLAGNALCLGCHQNPHAQHRSAEVKGAMTVVPADFPRNKGDLACTGCHAPHQAAERRLFVKPQGALCQTCHPV